MTRIYNGIKFIAVRPIGKTEITIHEEEEHYYQLEERLSEEYWEIDEGVTTNTKWEDHCNKTFAAANKDRIRPQAECYNDCNDPNCPYIHG